MSDKCQADCENHPDSVDKINWKCVECGRDLHEDIEKLFESRKIDAEEQAKESKLKEKGQLTDAQIIHRREMAQQ